MDLKDVMGWIVPGAAGSLLTLAVWGFQRRLKGERSAEAISRTTQLVDLHLKLAQHGLELDALDDLENQVLRRRALGRANEDQIAAELHAAANDPTENMTQWELNQYARNRFEQADAKVGEAIANLKLYMSDNEIEALDNAQEAWGRFRDLSSGVAALGFEGGSLQPFIYLAEQERLTIERAGSLAADFSDLKDRRVPRANWSDE